MGRNDLGRRVEVRKTGSSLFERKPRRGRHDGQTRGHLALGVSDRDGETADSDEELLVTADGRGGFCMEFEKDIPRAALSFHHASKPPRW